MNGTIQTLAVLQRQKIIFAHEYRQQKREAQFQTDVCSVRKNEVYC